jgi:hypothetical protein
MATITISEICPAGFELLQDSESFLDELNDREAIAIFGGKNNKIVYEPSVYETIVTNASDVNSVNTINTVTCVTQCVIEKKLKIKYK